jgi:hypothetical protein
MSEKPLLNYLRSATFQAVVIEWETVTDLCPQEAKAFLDALHRYGMDEFRFPFFYEPDADLDTLAQKLSQLVRYELPKKPTAKRPRSMAVRGDAGGAGNSPKSKHDELREAAKHVLAAWVSLSKAFRDATTVGGSYLTLRVGVPVLDEGAFDNLSALAVAKYAVDGAYQLSPAGTAFRDKLRLASDVDLDT